MRSHPIRSLVAAILLATVCTACGSGSSGSGSGSGPGPGSSSKTGSASNTGSTVLHVTRADGTDRPFTLADLERLPLASIMSNGQPQEGPRLLDVLQAAGVTGFSAVAVTGSNGTKTLARAAVTRDVILDFNNRGGVKLVSPSMPKPERIIDVTRIVVR